MQALAFALAVVAFALPARALDTPIAVALPTHSKDAAQGKVVDRALRDAIEALDKVELLPQPALDLEAVQLAIDCPDESARCLGEVAQRLKAQLLLAASIERKGDETVLRVLYYDRRGDEAPRTLERRAQLGEPEQKLLDAIPEMVRELLGEPAPAEPAAAPAEPSEPLPAPAAATSAPAASPSHPLPLGPLLLAGGGAVAIGTGLVFGALMKSTERDYAARPVETEMQAQLADQDRERGKQQALIANVLLGTGVAAVVAAGIWLGVDIKSREQPPQAALVPGVGPGSASVTLLGTWEARP